ncbi:transposase [Agathobaculum butyriciproducens]|nr:transposase [Agathobaculum butyriciproducens]RGC60830.1 transposase [Agathobaculum butyriciproducens]
MEKDNRAIRYRVYPTEKQRNILQQTFGCARLVFNETLLMHRGLYEAGMKPFSQMDMNNYCNRFMKENMPFLRNVDKFALTNSIYNAFAAFKNFFEGRNRYPRRKSRKDIFQSYTTNCTNNNIAIILHKKKSAFIKLPKLGNVPAVLHRLPKSNWVIKNATITKESGNRCYVSLLFEFEKKVPQNTALPTPENTLGLDYSSPEFYVDSNGNTAGVQHWYRLSQKRLAVEQRKLSHCTRGSRRYEKQKTKVNRLSGKIANQRKDFCHQKSRKIANSYAAVCVEDIDLRAMAQSLHFGKTVSDNGFGMFRNFLKYKLEEQGKHYIVIDKWYPSTKTCRHCGYVNPDVALGQKEWICPYCGVSIDRDHNAAINIRDEGIRQFYREYQTA